MKRGGGALTSITRAVFVRHGCLVSYLLAGTGTPHLSPARENGKAYRRTFVTVEAHFGAKRKNWGERKRADLGKTGSELTIVPYDERGIAYA